MYVLLSIQDTWWDRGWLTDVPAFLHHNHHDGNDRYPFNDTASSDTAVDYSGNGLDGALNGSNGVLPIFEGSNIRLNSDYNQFVTMPTGFMEGVARLDSFTATMTVMMDLVSSDAECAS